MSFRRLPLSRRLEPLHSHPSKILIYQKTQHLLGARPSDLEPTDMTRPRAQADARDARQHKRKARAEATVEARAAHQQVAAVEMDKQSVEDDVEGEDYYSDWALARSRRSDAGAPGVFTDGRSRRRACAPHR